MCPFPAWQLVSVNDALAVAPQSVEGHVSQFGSVSLLWSYSSPGHVSAQVAAIDASRSLSYTYPFMEPMAMPGHDSKQVLEGLWWKPDSGVTGSVTLSNTTEQQQTATLTSIHPGNSRGAQQVSLAPHSTQTLSLETLDADAPAPDNRAGGIRVEYQGPQGAILVNGGLANESEGYSANIPFWFHDMSSAPATSITLASAGLMLGKPDPMMMPGFPKDTTFSPYLALRNTTEKPLDVSLQVNYMTGMQGSTPVTKSLPSQHLAPSEARHLDLQGPLDAAGLKNFNGSINLSVSFMGKGGDLVFASGSVDQTGTYVFEVEPQGIASSRSKYSNYWGVANGNDTMYSLWNPTDQAEDIQATFYYGNGSGKYTLPVHIDSHASTMIDMAMLIMEKKPDANGNLIPSSIQEGSADFSSAKDRREMITLVLAGGLYNIATATCGEQCFQCCGVTEQPGTNPQVTPNPFSCAVGDSITLSGSAEDCQGYYYPPDTNGWTSDNTSVATVDGSGNVTCKDGGSVNISASWSNMVATTGQVCGAPSCPTYNPGAPAQGTVQVPTSLQFISVSVLPDGSTGAFGCPPSNNYGIRVDIKYQVLDQQSPAQPIKSSKMTPHEKGTLFDGTAFDNNIGPVSGYPTSSATTAADGTFHDVPFGYCQNTPINTPKTATQNITILSGSNSYPVRSQTWSVSAVGTQSFGHGTIKNTITSPSSGSDVSATR